MNSALNPNVVKTALDDVFMQEWNISQHPGFVTATSGLVFNQQTSDKAAEIMETFGGIGLWPTRTEEADVNITSPRITNNKTFTHAAFANSVEIPKHFFDDNMHGSYEKMVRDFATKGVATRDSNAFSVFRNAFTTALTSDGKALCADDHLTISGDTVDNKMTAALSETSLNDAILMLVEQKDQAGVIMGCVPSVLLVPPKLFKLACEIVDSELKSAGPNNDINVYSSKYGITVATSNRLGAAAGGSDTAWFLLAKNHSVTRFVRKGVETDLIPYQYTKNNVYVYKGEFRESVGAIDYAGIVGSIS